MPVPSLPSETIIQSSLQSIPAAPALVALARFTYAPGSFFPPAAGAGPVVFHMEAGLLHFQAEGPVFLTRGPAGNAAGPVEVLPGTEFDVSPGDQLLVPGNTSHSVRCISANTAQILGFALFPQVPPQQFPPGIQFVPLVLGMASILPKVPLNVTLDRVSYPSNSLRSQSYSGPSLFYMESGAVYSMLGSGQGQIMRAGSGPSTPPEPAVPGSETLLTSGDGLLLQPGSSLAFRNPANGTAVVLEAITRSEAEANRA